MNYRASDNRIYMLGYSKVASINASTFSDLQVVETNLPIQSFVFSKDETLINGVIDGSNVVASYRVYDKYAYIIGYSKLNLPIGNNYAQDSCYVDGRHLIMYGYTYNQATPFMIASVDFYGNVKQTFMINKAFIDVTELEGIALYGETVLVGSSTGVIYSFSKSLIDVYSTNSNNYSFEPCYYIPNFKKAPNETVQTSSGNYILCRTPYKPLNVFAFRYQPMQFNVRGEHVFGAEGMYSASARFANVKIQYNYTNDTLWLRYINIQDIGNKTFEEGTSLDTYKTELDSLFSSNWGDVSIRGYGIFPFNTVLGCLIQLLP